MRVPTKPNNGHWTDPLETDKGTLYGAAAMAKRIAMQNGMVSILAENARQAGRAAAVEVLNEVSFSYRVNYGAAKEIRNSNNSRPS
ncbi:hypothetical protein B9T23_01785 [Acinetobacter terrae]|uniref:hypothetical protein n=1 Tax=Acinetobacter terrae TaxID=2731247 RepID=UPI000A33F1FF|nr:hypothetical protein [Acinetobacter terrae]OTG78824.1 hypothetical protein B9T23_01785 [Acinetobacter terrae]